MSSSSLLYVNSRKQIGRFLYVLTPINGEYIIKNATRKGRINLIDFNVRKSNKDNLEEMENCIQERFQSMELCLQRTLQEHKALIEEFKIELQEHREQEKEHRDMDRHLFCSITKRIEALEVESNRLPSRSGHNL